MPQAKRAAATVSSTPIGGGSAHDLSTNAAGETAIGTVAGYAIFDTPRVPRKVKLVQYRSLMKVFEPDA